MPIDYNKNADTPAPVSLSKVILTKSAPTVSLTKAAAAKTGGLMRVNLNWTSGEAAPQSGGFFKKLMAVPTSSAIDLDLGCMYEFTDGKKGVVQALGNAFEAKPAAAASRLIWLDGDDRSGENTGGENLFIDLAQWDLVKRVLVFAYIYEGTPNWATANAVVTIHAEPEVTVQLDETRPARSCAIALLTNRGGAVDIRREVNYIDGSQSQIDAAYGWGMKWAAGHK